ncbi:early light-induced protein 1, chloroplastic [Selaginella moellendorffii]|uniref:early light-induced protein 1, chloroplastic n=1 Tax=Selaginella moellendorffii TaxID=88036 RepID=UPI000D1CF04C|nr:early light-induced protein 1, chloroplastic [Selaginella moellendorffii]|eukprot:XP_024527173.1 early light-induced protein 1, chloroplastic [Selaginella moellendorffii]
MASTVAARGIPLPTALSSLTPSSDSRLRGSHNASTSNSSRLSRCIVVRASQQQQNVGDLLEKTKKKITRESVEKHQEGTKSESPENIPLSIPQSQAQSPDWSYPRPEVERRPETGARDFGSLMAFDGPGPETINGRLAMLGLVWAFVAEKLTGETVAQLLYAPGNNGLFYYFAMVQLFMYASLVTMFNGESPDSRAIGPFTAKAERWNGRLAMMGFLSLVVNEAFINTPVFNLHM